MDKEIWSIAIKTTGPVAVVALLVWALLNAFFLPEVLAIFGSYHAFILTLALIVGLLSILLIAVLLYQHRREPPPNKPNNQMTVSNSTINGDVVFGNKKETYKK